MAEAEKELGAKNQARRLQLELKTDVASRLDQAKKISGDKSSAEAIRNSLKIYLYFLEQISSGHKVRLVKGEQIREVEFVF